jgi:acetyl/propionyl-CoA carboxylase alpha subunit
MSVQRRIFRRGDETYKVDAFLHGDQIEIHGGETQISWSFRPSGPDRVELLTATGPVRARYYRDGDVLWLHAGGRSYCLEIEIPGRARARGPAATRDDVLAPMTGTVRKGNVSPGDTVALGDPVVILEAMKMEHVLKAPRDGIVAEVRCAPGEQAEAQSVLLRLEETGSEETRPEETGPEETET